MNVEENFVLISGLLCEATRARMLWNLLDGRAYTATELAVAADISATSASNHLAKLLEADLVKVEIQGRHRYYSFAAPEIAYAVEALANLVGKRSLKKAEKTLSGVKYCRTCYDHLAGFVGVRIADALEEKSFIRKTEKAYDVTEKGWEWFAELGIFETELTNNRRPLTRQCLDWSERRPHIAGQLGAAFLDKILQKEWFKKIQFSRELEVSAKGRKELFEILGIDLRS
ncbi:MAG TPA: helix-turn-helix domain-containing protein [Pyrinomonadaceae bacterium]|nr:helix-turn-helix domain-containing protein [Pyrinomonadaceae bacterium]